MSDTLQALNTRQQAFTDYYLANGNNATQAALAAGYTPGSAYNQGCRLMKNDEIIRQVAEFNSRLADNAEITRDYLNGRLRLTMDQDPVGKPSHADLRGAVETAARVNGLIVDKSEISGEITFEGFKKRINATIEAQPDRKRLQELGE